VNHREASLITDGVIAPYLCDVHLVFGGQTARDIYRACRDVKMKWRAGTAEMRPLRHRLEVVDGFSRFDLDGPHELVTLLG